MKAENITRTLVEDHGFSYEKLAGEIGCSVNSVKNWYDGTKPIRIFENELKKILEKVEEK